MGYIWTELNSELTCIELVWGCAGLSRNFTGIFDSFFELWIDLGAKNHEDSEPFSLLFNLGCILLKRIAGGSD